MTSLKIESPESFDIDSGLLLNLLSVKYSEDRWKNFKPFTITGDCLEFIEKKKNMNIYEDDVFVCSFPRSGTTLTQEMVWLIMHDFDFEAAKSEVLDNRFPELE